MRSFRKIVAMVFALTMTLALAACGGNMASSTSSVASDSSASAAASASGDSVAADASGASAAATSSETSSSAEAQPAELVGKPWVTSILMGNLPAEQPELKDDLYTHYNYDFLAAHQNGDANQREEGNVEIPAALRQIIQDDSKTSHDLEQLRIFYDQATDVEALQAAGMTELQPYLDRIDAVTSIDEMNAVLTAKDFPFSPFILAVVTTNDTRTTNIVGITPNLVLFDSELVGGMYYQDTDDPQQQAVLDMTIQSAAIYSMVDLMITGSDDTSTLEERQALAKQLIDFEKAHAKHLEAQSLYLKSDYGAMADVSLESYFSLDELCALAPNFPMKETLEKLGKAKSTTYVTTREWLEAFNDLWTADNLDAIKLVAKTKLLDETRPFRDPSAANDILTEYGMLAKDTDTFAYEACSNINTFGHVMAKAYVDDVLGQQAKERLSKLSQDLVGEYKALVDATPWIGAESKKRVIEKLDHMTLNVLEPVGGYFDYSNLELTPTDQGGTLLSNYLKLKQHRWDCESKMIGAPVVPASPWFMFSPLMNNAFYDTTSNSINILPGFITSQVYRDDMDDAELLARCGFTIGHEISHSFDYTGSQIDAYGQPNPVFTDADVDLFVLKTTTLASYYHGIEIGPGLYVDGQNVAGEAAADLCGMQASLELAKKSPGFDYDKYFSNVAGIWAEVMSNPALQQQTLDNHPISNLRVNVNAQMFDPIYDELGVAEGDGMYLAPDERINIWGPNA